MLKSLIASVTALSLATATPAAAQGLDREDVGKLLIGLAAVAVIGAAIEENRDNRESTPAHHNNGWGGIDRNNSWSGIDRNNNNNRRVLPHDCLRQVETRFGTQRMFGRRCLERNYRHANSLPDRCEVRVFAENGPRNGYDPRCLRQQGYTTDRRH